MQSDRAGEDHPQFGMFLTQASERVQHFDRRELAVGSADVIDHVRDLIPQKDWSDLLLLRAEIPHCRGQQLFPRTRAARLFELFEFVLVVDLASGIRESLPSVQVLLDLLIHRDCEFLRRMKPLEVEHDGHPARRAVLGHLPQHARLSDPPFRVDEHARLVELSPKLGNEAIAPINVFWINDTTRIRLHEESPR